MGGSLGASVRADVRVCLASSGRFYLECTVGGPVVYMGRNKNGQTKRGVRGRVQFFVKFCFVPAVGPGGFALGYSSVQFSSALDRGLGFMSSLS